jgi:translation initiation factor IF-3
MINDEISSHEVLVVDADGTQLGILAISEARSVAARQRLDLVEVGPFRNPPVCRVMDYGGYLRDRAARRHEGRKPDDDDRDEDGGSGIEPSG